MQAKVTIKGCGATDGLTLKQITKEEGIYRPVDDGRGETERVLVVINRDGSGGYVLYICEDCIEALDPKLWKNDRFVKTNETLALIIN
jgi:hypothetical protein